jgi:hypothetical protein
MLTDQLADEVVVRFLVVILDLGWLELQIEFQRFGAKFHHCENELFPYFFR